MLAETRLLRDSTNLQHGTLTAKAQNDATEIKSVFQAPGNLLHTMAFDFTLT
jgi:hypothetical protein